MSDVPDEADWPEIEEALVPESTFMPDAGPFARPFEYLHGARATLDGDLAAPTRLLTVTAARSLLRVVDETGTEIDDERRHAFERVAQGEISADEDEIVPALGEMAAFVETNLDLGND